MTARFDAIAIGGGVGGLVASACLKRLGLSVLLLEASDVLGGDCRGAPLLRALDPRVVKDLGLMRRGLKLAARDVPLLSLRQDGRHLLLARDPHEAARAIAAHSSADAEAYKRFHAELFALARALRPWWWEEAAEVPSVARHPFETLEATSANAWLSFWFESEALKTALAFDAPDPDTPGSALALVWHAAQEIGGLQGAVALAQGGGTALAEQLISAVQDGGVEIRTKARVKSLVLADNVAAGVELDSGEKIFARAIVSGLSRRRTLLGLAPTASAGIAETLRLERAAPRRRETVFVFTLNAAPEFPQHGARLIATEGAPALEAVVTTSALPGQHLLAVRAKAETSADDVVAQLERFTPHLKGRIVSCETSVRDVLAPHLFDPAAARIATPIKGLFLCGADAEPMAAVSGRAGRLAADTIARKKRA